MDICTSSFRAARPTDGHLIATSVGRRGPAAQLDWIAELAPFGIFNVKPALSLTQYHPRYMERLDRHRAKIEHELDVRFQQHGRLVLLCWCTLASPVNTEAGDSWCHRRMIAEWLGTNYGLDVPELAATGEAVRRPRQGRKLTEPAHPTLDLA